MYRVITTSGKIVFMTDDMDELLEFLRYSCFCHSGVFYHGRKRLYVKCPAFHFAELLVHYKNL